MTQKTRSTFISDANTTLADNTTGAITAAALRNEVKNLADSAVFPEDFPRILNSDIVTVTDTAYTAANTDAGKYIEVSTTSNSQITINASVFSAKDEIVIEQNGAGIVEIVSGAGMTINSRDNARKSAGRYAVLALKFKSANNATLTGDIVV